MRKPALQKKERLLFKLHTTVLIFRISSGIAIRLINTFTVFLNISQLLTGERKSANGGLVKQLGHLPICKSTYAIE